MKKMHWLGVIATSLMSLTALAGCSGDDAPAAPGTGATSATGGGGAAATAGTTTGGTATAGTGGGSSNMGVQLDPPAYYVALTGADAMAGAAAPAAYMANGCNACHNPNGEGNIVGPEIRFTPKEYFTAAVRTGRKDYKGTQTAMLPVAADKLTDADLDAISAWLNGLPKPTTGQGLYKAMCGNCHGPMMPTGGGSPIKIQGATVANVDKFVRMGGTGTDVNDRLKYMPKYDTTLLTDAELTMIKTFIGAI